MRLQTVLLTMLIAFPVMPLLAQDSLYVPRHERPSGREVVALYVGADSCGPCHDPKLKEALEEMKLLLDQRAQNENWSFAVIGLALDWDVKTGYDFLVEAGAFDEVILGRNWFNLGATEYLWKDENAQPFMPQVIVYERHVSTQQSTIEIAPRHVLARYHMSEFIEWVDQGAPIDSP